MTSYSEKLNNDIVYGLNEENNIKNILENHFNIKLKKPKDKFKSYDLKGKNIRIEIKSRKIKSTQYPTTFLCNSKLKYYNKKIKRFNKKYIIVFNYLDEIKIIEFNDDLYNLPLKKIRISRGDLVENIEIPVKSLTTIYTRNI
jgi:hypothetical protein